MDTKVDTKRILSDWVGYRGCSLESRANPIGKNPVNAAPAAGWSVCRTSCPRPEQWWRSWVKFRWWTCMCRPSSDGRRKRGVADIFPVAGCQRLMEFWGAWWLRAPDLPTDRPT